MPWASLCRLSGSTATVSAARTPRPANTKTRRVNCLEPQFQTQGEPLNLRSQERPKSFKPPRSLQLETDFDSCRSHSLLMAQTWGEDGTGGETVVRKWRREVRRLIVDTWGSPSHSPPGKAATQPAPCSSPSPFSSAWPLGTQVHRVQSSDLLSCSLLDSEGLRTGRAWPLSRVWNGYCGPVARGEGPPEPPGQLACSFSWGLLQAFPTQPPGSHHLCILGGGACLQHHRERRRQRMWTLNLSLTHTTRRHTTRMHTT